MKGRNVELEQLVIISLTFKIEEGNSLTSINSLSKAGHLQYLFLHISQQDNNTTLQCSYSIDVSIGMYFGTLLYFSP